MKGPLLGVWAHPDDEAYLSAGLMAAAVRAGRRVVVLTMTAGEHGTDDPQRWPPERLGPHRRDELRSSLALLGVTEHDVVGLPDGACDQHDATALIAGAVAQIEPATIVTFGPEGMTGHPDHRAVSSWTTRAWSAAGAPGDLWYATVTHAFHARWGGLNHDVGLWADQPVPPRTRVSELTALIELDRAEQEQKLAALRAHASQSGSLIDLIGEDRYRQWWAAEAFVAAKRPAEQPGRFLPPAGVAASPASV